MQRSGDGEGCCMDTVTRMIHSLLLLISNSHDIGYKNDILGLFTDDQLTRYYHNR